MVGTYVRNSEYACVGRYKIQVVLMHIREYLCTYVCLQQNVVSFAGGGFDDVVARGQGPRGEVGAALFGIG